MSEFKVPIVEIKNIIPIEGADKIEVAEVLGYQSVVGKGSYKIGDKVFYLPEQSLLPQE